MKLGVIDLGTNTFHLLIIQPLDDGSFKEIYRKRIFVQLAEDGIATIGQAAFQRGLEAMAYFSTILKEHHVVHVRALGTAALRTASNGPDFVLQVQATTGISIERIPGDEEARLICEGVRLAVPIDHHPVLVMDIGGGSVEFIIANHETQFWAQSYPIGVAVLFNQFHKNDPITKQEVSEVRAFLKQTLQPLINALKNYPVKQLVGASGTFDVLEAILVDEKTTPHFSSIPRANFQPVYQALLYSTLADRLSNPGIPDQRAKLIIVALLLIDFVLELADIDAIWVSAYAMKEGVLSDLMQKS